MVEVDRSAKTRYGVSSGETKKEPRE